MVIRALPSHLDQYQVPYNHRPAFFVDILSKPHYIHASSPFLCSLPWLVVAPAKKDSKPMLLWIMYTPMVPVSVPLSSLTRLRFLTRPQLLIRL
jgi:hypothetical protein